MLYTRDEFLRKLVKAASRKTAAPVIYYDRILTGKNYANLIIALANEKERQSVRELELVDTDRWEVIFVGKDRFDYSDLFEFDEEGEIWWCGNFADRNWKQQFLDEVKKK